MKAQMVINTMNSLYGQIVRYKKEFDENEGIYFVCEIESECYGYEDDGNTYHEEWCGRAYKIFHVIMLQNNKVFINIQNDRSLFEIPQEGWENTSNHDSCWRSDRGCAKLIRIGFNLWDEAHKNCPDKFKPKTRDESITFDINPRLTNIFKLVSADIKLKDDGYHYTLSNIKKIKKTISL